MSAKAAILEGLLDRIKKNRAEMIIERENALQAVPDIEEATAAEVETEEITFHDSTQELDPVTDVEEITEPVEADFPVEPSMDEAKQAFNESHQYAPPAESITSIVPEEPVAVEEPEEVAAAEEPILPVAPVTPVEPVAPSTPVTPEPTSSIDEPEVSTESTEEPEQYNPVVFDQKPQNIKTVVKTTSDVTIKSYSLSAVLDRAFNLGK
jgi:hypothetical protein